MKVNRINKMIKIMKIIKIIGIKNKKLKRARHGHMWQRAPRPSARFRDFFSILKS